MNFQSLNKISSVITEILQNVTVLHNDDSAEVADDAEATTIPQCILQKQPKY